MYLSKFQFAFLNFYFLFLGQRASWFKPRTEEVLYESEDFGGAGVTSDLLTGESLERAFLKGSRITKKNKK